MKQKLRMAAGAFVAIFAAGSLNAQINTFPYSEDFETFNTCTGSCNSPCTLLNGWSNEQGGGDNAEWTVDIGGTTSSSTGPSVDYDPGTASGKYLYIESSSPCNNNATAIMYMPQLDLTSVSAMNMIFANHMYGSSQGTMYVEVSSDGGITWNTEWSKTGDQGDVWYADTVNLSAYIGGLVNVRFRGVTGTNFYSDMAVDAITLYEPLQYDAGITAIPSPGLPSCNLANSSVEATITNFGFDTIYTVTIDWWVNSVQQTSYSWADTLLPGQTTNQVIGVYSFNDGDLLEVATSNPNGMAETGSGPSNDLFAITISSGLAGTYTIGATGNYSTFGAAIADLNTFGVCDDVTFNVEDGIYMESIVLAEVLGMNDTNTVTFQSLNANPMLATLTYNGTVAADNQVIHLDGGDNYIFRNLSIVNGGATYGTVIRVENGAHKNTFEGNIIAGATGATTTSTNMALVYSPSNSLDTMNVFDGNDFLNGSYSMYWYGGNTSTLEYGTKIINNNFTDFYYRGIMSYYQQDVEIGGNTLMPSPTYTGALYRLYMYYNQGGTRVYNNKIGGMNYGYGMYLSSCDGTAANPGYFYNNMVHVGDTNSTSTSYGIYSVSNDFTVVTNNSINIRSNGTSSRGVYYSSGNNNTFKNNSVKNEGPGYGMYILSGLNESENNNVYVPNGTLFYSGGNINDLATWQANTGWDLASDTLDPMYFSGDDLHTCQDLSIDMGATPDSMVMYDIDGQLRDANTPDIGADEFLGMANLAFAEDTIWKCSQDAVTLGGWEPQDDANYQWSNLQTTPTVNVTAEGAYFVNVSGTCGNASPSVYVANIPDANASFTTFGSFMTGVYTNTSTGTIDTYHWDYGDGTTSNNADGIHVYADTGMYIVTLTVTGPCGSDTYTDTMYSSVVGLDEYALENSLNVYPNPNSGTFTLNLSVAQAAEVSAVLTDLQGKAVWSREMGTVNGMIEEDVKLSGNATGIYILKVTVDGESAVRRVVVK